MNWNNILIGTLLIILGIFLIKLYQNLKRKNKTGGLSFKLQTGGIGFIMIGIYIIYQEL
jgi:hypothetical protein